MGIYSLTVYIYIYIYTFVAFFPSTASPCWLHPGEELGKPIGQDLAEGGTGWLNENIEDLVTKRIKHGDSWGDSTMKNLELGASKVMKPQVTVSPKSCGSFSRETP